MKRIVFITSNRLGVGEEELGEALMKAFLDNLGKVESRPDGVIFMNAGVHLVAEGATTIGPLKALESAGTEILACGTCLDYYHLMDRVAVGRVSNMNEITTCFMNADNVITP
jgi:selenium metabolism protein YedF